MEYLLTPRNLKVLESFKLVNTVYAFDFDGTLAPIVDVPDEARMRSNTAQLMHQLNEKFPVAVISGRSVADLKTLLTFQPRYLIGNHGLEGIADVMDLELTRSLCCQWKKIILSRFEKKFEELHITVEDKQYSLSIHYRNATIIELAQKCIGEALSYLPPSARVVGGKLVYNIVPTVAPDKGMALNQIMAQDKFNFGLFIGDDTTDEDVFLYSSPKLITIRVGYVANSHATYYLKDQSEIDQMLDFILSHPV